MWAHYADGHQGAVIAINVKKAGFTGIETNMIPAHFGNVTYTRFRPDGPYLSKPMKGVIVGETHNFEISHYEKWQRLFLTKPLEWAYEEEVRVVKCVNGLNKSAGTNKSGSCTLIQLSNHPLYCFDIPPNAIESVYFGARVQQSEIDQFKKDFPSVNFQKAVLDQNK